jgi:Skp family chaperone for outer membrane proteins
MKNQVIALLVFLTIGFNSIAQSKGVRIGYIDMEYILQNVPNYTEAKNQLEQKAQTWKTELETKKSAITKLQDNLKSERVLLTKELIEEREEEIKFQETELADYQQKRFGPNGDLIVQKTLLVQPVQDQVFNAVQDISEAKRYDFVFDKSSDLTMLFASKRFDISDQVLRVITRSSKRSQMNKKQIQEDEAKEKKLEEVEDNPGLVERQKIIDDKKAAREKLLADKKLLAEERKKEFDAKRQKLIDEKEAKKNGTVLGNETNIGSNNSVTTPKADSNNSDNEAKEEAKKAREEKIAAQKAEFEARKKAIEEKRLKTIADREAAKKAKLEGAVPKN